MISEYILYENVEQLLISLKKKSIFRKSDVSQILGSGNYRSFLPSISNNDREDVKILNILFMLFPLLLPFLIINFF